MEENYERPEYSEINQRQAPVAAQEQSLPNATATLVLGILSIVMCGIGLVMGIIAMVLHKKDKALYESNPAVYDQSFKTARAGYICGLIGTILSACIVVFYIIYFVFIFSFIASSAAFNA